MTTATLRKSALVLIFTLVSAGEGKTLVQPAAAKAPEQFNLAVGDAGGTNPDPTCGPFGCSVPTTPGVLIYSVKL